MNLINNYRIMENIEIEKLATEFAKKSDQFIVQQALRQGFIEGYNRALDLSSVMVTLNNIDSKINEIHRNTKQRDFTLGPG